MKISRQCKFSKVKNHQALLKDLLSIISESLDVIWTKVRNKFYLKEISNATKEVKRNSKF